MRSDLRKLGSTLEQRTRTAVEFLEIARELDEVMKAAVALAPRLVDATPGPWAAGDPDDAEPVVGQIRIGFRRRPMTEPSFPVFTG